MVINKTSSYKRCLGKLKKSHKNGELNRVRMIEEILTGHDNLQMLVASSMWKVYRFEKLKGDRKDAFSARINQQYRLEFKPVNKPGYEMIDVIELDLIEISNHYKKL